MTAAVAVSLSCGSSSPTCEQTSDQTLAPDRQVTALVTLFYLDRFHQPTRKISGTDMLVTHTLLTKTLYSE